MSVISLSTAKVLNIIRQHGHKCQYDVDKKLILVAYAPLGSETKPMMYYIAPNLWDVLDFLGY